MAPKYQMIADALKRDIIEGAYRTSTILPTEFAIAEQFDVSRQTVRQALSLLAEEGLIVRKQGSGSHIVRTTPKRAPSVPRNIAVVISYISDYIFPSILREVEKVLSHYQCTPLLFATQNQVANERKILTTLLRMEHLDGILVEGTKTCLPNPNLDLYQQLMERGIPLVFINGYYPQLQNIVSVLDDNFGGGRLLVEYLYEKGHRKISGIFKNDDMQGHGRYAGFMAGLQQHNLPMDDHAIYWYSTADKERLFDGQPIPEELLKALDGSTAVVCYNDEIASRLISHLLKTGVKIPDELAVVSFDNSHYSAMSPVPITSLSHGSYNVGKMAAELLMESCQGIPVSSTIAPWILIEKESS